MSRFGKARLIASYRFRQNRFGHFWPLLKPHFLSNRRSNKNFSSLKPYITLILFRYRCWAVDCWQTVRWNPDLRKLAKHKVRTSWGTPTTGPYSKQKIVEGWSKFLITEISLYFNWTSGNSVTTRKSYAAIYFRKPWNKSCHKKTNLALH